MEKITINVEHCVWRICMLSYKLLYSGASFYDVQLIRRVHVAFPCEGETECAPCYLEVLRSLMFIWLLRNSIKLFSFERRIFEGLIRCATCTNTLGNMIVTCSRKI